MRLGQMVPLLILAVVAAVIPLVVGIRMEATEQRPFTSFRKDVLRDLRRLQEDPRLVTLLARLDG
jgi:hypothetical protein